jgi:hypothetical protein
MKRLKIASLLFVCWTVMLTACNTTTPENYFDQAVLNTNMLSSFASDRLTQEIVSYSAQSEAAKAQNMSAVKSLEMKVQFIENALKKIKALKETDDTREMLKASIAVHEYVLPVFKNEYMDLAKQSDNGVLKEEIARQAEVIANKYGPQYDVLMNKLTDIGKVYAQKHGIQVNWGH